MGVPYQGGDMTSHLQYLTVRNGRGQEMLDAGGGLASWGQQCGGRQARAAGRLLPACLLPAACCLPACCLPPPRLPAALL